jgi:hypothetical protein
LHRPGGVAEVEGENEQIGKWANPLTVGLSHLGLATSWSLGFSRFFAQSSLIVVEDQGHPYLVMLDSQEYARYVAWRRRDAVRAFILGEMDRRQVEPWWDRGFDALNTLRPRAQDLTPTEIEALIDESGRSFA